MRTLYEAVVSRKQTQNVVKVKVDNIKAHIANNSMGFEDIIRLNPAVLPPYNVLWLEHETRTVITGYLCVRVDLTSRPDLATNTDHRWMVTVTKFSKDKASGRISSPEKYRILVTSANAIAKDEKGWMIYGARPKSADREGFFDLDSLSLPLFVLTLMCCKNVRLEKSGFSDYHTLVVLPDTNELETRKPTRNAAFRRGHLKDYRQGGGLFGKHHDLYWFEA